MDFTLIVLSYNHPEITSRAVRSAVRLAPGKTLLVHNGSLHKHVLDLKARFPEIEHLVLPVNQGYSGGANAGLQAAHERSEWAIFMSNDCELESLPRLAAYPCVLIPVIYRRKTSRIDSFGGGFQPDRARIFHHRADSGSDPDYVPGSAFAVHREVTDKAGLMDTRLGTYWDDVDWSMRVREAGFRLVRAPGFSLRHHIGKTCHDNPLYSIYYFQRNRKKIAWKYAPRARRPLLAVHLAKSWLSLGYGLVRKGRWKDLKHLHRAVVD